MRKNALLVWIVLLAVSRPVGSADPSLHEVQALKVTVLSTMLADVRGLGEWGFAALVEVDGDVLLYDTGYHPDIVLANARALGVDLSAVRDVVLSHNHGDHTGGLVTLRRVLRAADPDAIGRAHVGAGLFAPRRFPDGLAKMGFEFPPMNAVRADYEALGGQVREYDAPVELRPGVWLTGPVPRVHPEKNWSPGVRVERDGVWKSDQVLEDSALVINTPRGLVVVTGCGHAGVINILDFAQTLAPGKEVNAVLGGLHLFAAGDDVLDWTAANLARHRVANLLGAHCTGIQATHHLRERLGLGRENAAVGAVGASFTLGQGIDPLRIAR